MVLVMAVMAYYFEKIDIPTVPIVLAFVMGPIVEGNLNKALTIHAGDLMTVITRPIALTIFAMSFITVVYSFWTSFKAPKLETGTLKE
jgi:putative tricarboxylic transport membrane protein